MNKVLIIGNSGMLGNDLSNVFYKNGYNVIGLDINLPKFEKIDKHYTIDLFEKEQVLKVLEIEKPDLIIYTAAIVNLELCENNKLLAKTIHATIPELIAKNKENKTKFLYISTDSVFDGKNGNYCEEDLPNPLNYYSESKVLGEQLLLQYRNCLIIRTNIYGFNNPLKQSLAEWAIINFKNDKTIIGFDDILFNAIYTMDLANIIEKISNKRIEGILNIACDGIWSKYDFLLTLAKKMGFSENLVEKGESSSIDFKIKRPLHTNLNTHKIQKIIKIPTLEESINHFCINFKKNNL